MNRAHKLDTTKRAATIYHELEKRIQTWANIHNRFTLLVLLLYNWAILPFTDMDSFLLLILASVQKTTLFCTHLFSSMTWRTNRGLATRYLLFFSRDVNSAVVNLLLGFQRLLFLLSSICILKHADSPPNTPGPANNDPGQAELEYSCDENSPVPSVVLHICPTSNYCSQSYASSLFSNWYLE